MQTSKNNLLLICLALICNIPPAPAISQSTPEESPFLWFAKPYYASPPEVSKHVIGRYGDTPERFPTAASCGYAEASKFRPLEPAIVTTKEEFEVCLFRVLAKLKTATKINEWMVRSGWTLRSTLMISEEARFFASQGGLYASDASLQRRFYLWDIESNGVPYGREKLIEVRNSIVVEVVYSSTRGIVHVSSSTHSIWSK